MLTQAREEGGAPLGRVAILGLGLMGGSLARGVSSLGLAERITGWSPRSTERDAALTTGAVGFAAADWRNAVSDADLVVLAIPLAATVDLLPELAGATPASTTLTDVASLKAPLVRAAVAADVTSRWVGTHPMAGGETSGFWASRADLYEGARVWTVRAEGRAADGHPGQGEGHAEGGAGAAGAEEASGGVSDIHQRRVDRLWRGLGAEPTPIDAEEHDRLMGLVSHLPQLVSNVLASVLLEEGVDPRHLGPGGRDMTRLAAGNPLMWVDLLEHASEELVEALRGLGREATRAADLLEQQDLAGLELLMKRTRDWKRAT